MSPASVVAWMLAGSVVYIAVCAVRAIVKARRKVLPPPTKEATRKAETRAVP